MGMLKINLSDGESIPQKTKVKDAIEHVVQIDDDHRLIINTIED